ncbi:alpha/beta fold hydrolase [Niveispirillum sp. KHB5.9]|uniref:alpha/beta fold hydrolase n=1 Tax=Niveispirillum sp. KHB5.9 TaxID=3400269 RepID=UPI003A8A7B5E
MSLWTQMLGGEVGFVQAGGLRTRYVRLGQGAPLLLLHGRGGHLETFARTIGPLSVRFTVYAIDLAGHGLTEGFDGDYTIDRLAAHVADTIKALGLDRPHVVGQSLGGWAAAWLALNRPELLERLVLIEPAGLQAEAERLADPKIAQAYKAGGEAFEKPTLEAVRKRLSGLLADPDSVDPEILATRLALYQPEAARAVHLKVRQADNGPFLLTPERLAGLSMPTLFIRGNDGNTDGQIVARAVSACPDAQLAVVEGARQWPQYEQADRTNSLIGDFLKDGRE